MPAVSIRNLSEKTHEALRRRAARNGRSTEAEIRAILEDAVALPKKPGLGARLAAIGREFGGIDLEIARDTAPRPPISFE